METREIEQEEDIILSFETAVKGGSISLLQNERLVDCWIGSENMSKSVDILEETRKILERNALERKSIKKIVVSNGPGSQTGIRVGMALGFGLKRSLDCEIASISSLYAMVLNVRIKATESHSEGETIAALPVGRNQICWQSFGNVSGATNDNQCPAQTSTVEEFVEFYKKATEKGTVFTRKNLIVHSKLYLRLKSEFIINQEFIEVTDVGENIACLNGIAALKLAGDKKLLISRL